MSTHIGYLQPLSREAFDSLGSMEGVYQPIVQIAYLDLSPDAALSFGSMEGQWAHSLAPSVTLVPPAARPGDREAADNPWPGVGLAVTVAVLSYALDALPWVPIGATILAILVGVAVRNLLPMPRSVATGCKMIVKKVIPLAIVMTGAGLDLGHVAGIGARVLLVTVLCVVVAIAAAYYCGRLCGLGPRSALLIGTGTGICGNSAVIAIAPLIDADDEDLVLSIGTINLFGLLAMLACPALGGLLHLSDQAFGVWAGTTIHAVPQVVAAGFAFSAGAGTVATLVKLVRVTLLAPLVAILAVAYARRHSADIAKGRNVAVHYARFVPWFVWGFVLLAVARTFGLIPTLGFDFVDTLLTSAGRAEFPLTDVLAQAAKVLLTVAMAAIGVEINLKLLAGVGARAVFTGMVAFVVLAAASLLLIVVLL